METSCCDIVDSGVLRISKKGAKCLLAPSAHTKEGGQTKFSNFLLCQKQIFWQRGHGRFGQGVNTPLIVDCIGYTTFIFHAVLHSFFWIICCRQ